MNHRFHFTTLALSIFCFCVSGASAQAGKIDSGAPYDLVGHKALYSIEMVEKRSSSQVLNISGKMFFEMRPQCDAWTTDHRFNLDYEYADSPPLHITSDFSTYEPFDGKTFDFSSRRKRNGEMYQELRGSAAFSEDGKGRIVYNMPDDLEYDLPPDGFFPMAHTIKLLKEIKDGSRIFNATVFDGSDEEGPVEINAFIGKPVNAIASITPVSSVDTSLINSKAWKVRMAFFPVMESNENADYEMDVVLHENGVISDMIVEYDEFSVSQKLVALEKLEPVPCKAAEPEKTQKENGSQKPGLLKDKTVR